MAFSYVFIVAPAEFLNNFIDISPYRPDGQLQR